jgi:hypothetical protein
MSKREVVLHYTIITDEGETEEQKLFFYQRGDENSAWECVLTADEMNRIIRSALDKGSLEDGSN